MLEYNDRCDLFKHRTTHCATGVPHLIQPGTLEIFFWAIWWHHVLGEDGQGLARFLNHRSQSASVVFSLVLLALVQNTADKVLDKSEGLECQSLALNARVFLSRGVVSF